ncbi:MAG: hypothetical protein ACR2O6_09820 [Ilumatobacteraceae bacterium]
MSGAATDRSTRLVRWWARRYTAGLDQPAAACRRAEIDSDLAEHEHSRRESDWPAARVGRERIGRMLAGLPADVGWRHDQLRRRSRHGLASALIPVTTLASLLLAAYYLAFAAYLIGNTAVADQQAWGRLPLGGFTDYADEAGGMSPAVGVIASLGLLLAVAAVARPVAPVLANAVILPIAMLAVMFFWLGAWPLALVVLAGAVTDLATRAPQAPAE